MKKKILVFIPCFNVSKYVFSTFQKIPFKEINKLAKVSYLFIEDCSNDQTYLVIKKLKNNYLFRNMNNKISIIKNKINLGYGGVQKLAYNYCKKKKIDFCIMLHGDGQYNPMYLPKFIKLLLKYCNIINNKNLATNEVRVLGVFGSRMIDWKKAIKGNMPIYKFIGNKFLTYVQNFLLSTSMSEFHSGYRSYDVKNLNMINYSILKYTDDMFCIYHNVCEKEFNIGRKLLYSRNKQEVEYCIFCNPIDAQQSHLEREITEFIKSFNIDVIENSRSIINSEIDIFLPKFKIAFEINGVYWHNEIFKDKSYHINKTNECIKSGIQLIHIWEDDWKNKKDIAKSMILNKINKIEDRIYARKCIIKKINDISIIRKFLNENHIQGYSPSMYKYGLFLNNELVSLMTFGWRKTNSKREFELIRFCNKINTNVIGSASKLFNFALTNIDVNEIISYCDISQFDGNVYNTTL